MPRNAIQNSKRNVLGWKPGPYNHDSFYSTLFEFRDCNFAPNRASFHEPYGFVRNLFEKFRWKIARHISPPFEMLLGPPEIFRKDSVRSHGLSLNLIDKHDFCNINKIFSETLGRINLNGATGIEVFDLLCKIEEMLKINSLLVSIIYREITSTKGDPFSYFLSCSDRKLT